MHVIIGDNEPKNFFIISNKSFVILLFGLHITVVKWAEYIL